MEDYPKIDLDLNLSISQIETLVNFGLFMVMSNSANDINNAEDNADHNHALSKFEENLDMVGVFNNRIKTIVSLELFEGSEDDYNRLVTLSKELDKAYNQLAALVATDD